MSSPYEDTTKLPREAAAHLEDTMRYDGVAATVGTTGAKSVVEISGTDLIKEEAARLVAHATAASSDPEKLATAFTEAMRRFGLDSREPSAPLGLGEGQQSRVALLGEVDPDYKPDTRLGFAQMGERTLLDFARTHDAQNRPALEVTNLTALIAAEAAINEQVPYGSGDNEEDRNFRFQAKSLADYQMQQQLRRVVPMNTPIVIGRPSPDVEDSSHAVSEIMVDQDRTVSRAHLQVNYSEASHGGQQRVMLDVEHLSQPSVTGLYDAPATKVAQVVSPH